MKKKIKFRMNEKNNKRTEKTITLIIAISVLALIFAFAGYNDFSNRNYASGKAVFEKNGGSYADGGGEVIPFSKPGGHVRPRPKRWVVVTRDFIFNTNPLQVKVSEECGNFNFQIKNLRNFSINNIVINIEQNTEEINPLISSKIYGWDLDKTGMRFTGNIPYIKNTQRRAFVGTINPNGTKNIAINSNFALRIMGKKKIQFTIVGEQRKGSAEILDKGFIQSNEDVPDFSVYAEKKESLINIYAVFNEQGVYDYELNFNKIIPYEKNPGFIGLWNSLFNSPQTVFNHYRKNFIVNGKTILAQQFESADNFDFNQVELDVYDSETGDKIEKVIADCSDGVCVPYSIKNCNS